MVLPHWRHAEDDVPLNYETENTCSIRVRATDKGGLSVEKPLTISVTNRNESPTDIVLSSDAIPEAQPAGTVVGSFSTIDPDFDNTFTYSLVDGSGSDDNAEFVLDGDALITTAVLDYETCSYYTIRVRSTDQDGLYTERAFAIAVTNVNESPTDVSLANTAIAENQPAGTVVGSFTTTDPDAGNTFFYALVSGDGSTDNAQFTIDGDTLKTAASVRLRGQEQLSDPRPRDRRQRMYTEKELTISVLDVGDYYLLEPRRAAEPAAGDRRGDVQHDRSAGQQLRVRPGRRPGRRRQRPFRHRRRRARRRSPATTMRRG